MNEQETQTAQQLGMIEQKESLELDLTAKGLYKWTIKLRGDFLTTEYLERLANLEGGLRVMFKNNVIDGIVEEKKKNV